jgi:hypothetical protein
LWKPSLKRLAELVYILEQCLTSSRPTGGSNQKRFALQKENAKEVKRQERILERRQCTLCHDSSSHNQNSQGGHRTMRSAASAAAAFVVFVVVLAVESSRCTISHDLT